MSLSLVISSVLMLIAADGLRRGRRVAWWFVTVLTVLSLIVVIGAAPSSERNADFVIVIGQLLLLLVDLPGLQRPLAPPLVPHRPGGACCGSPSACSSTPPSASSSCRTTSSRRAKPIDMLAEFFSRLIFTTSGNIEPNSTPAPWFVNSIGAIWLIDDPRHRRRDHLLEPAATPGARCRHPAARPAAPAPVVEHRVDADLEGHHRLVHRRRRDGHRLRGRRLGRPLPRRPGRTDRASARTRCGPSTTTASAAAGSPACSPPAPTPRRSDRRSAGSRWRSPRTA